MKLIYKPIAVQNECFGGTEKDPEITVMVKLKADGKTKAYYKNDAMSFPDRNYLDKFISDNKLEILLESDFRALPVEMAQLIIKAIE